MHYYAFVIIKIDESIKKKVSELIETEKKETEKLNAELKMRPLMKC